MNEDSEYGDNERLAVLGKKALEAAVTDTLFKKRPMLNGDQIEVRYSHSVSSLATHIAIATETVWGAVGLRQRRELDHRLQATREIALHPRYRPESIES